VPTATAVAVLAVGALAFGHAVAHGQAPHGAAVAAPDDPVIVTPVITETPRPPSTPHHRKVSHHAHHRVRRPAVLAVTDVGGPCYIQVTRQGHLLVRRILHHGEHVAFRRHGLDVVLGNAGGVRVSINGHHAHRAGRAGQVRTFRVH
jgi:hypothetical protein